MKLRWFVFAIGLCACASSIADAQSTAPANAKASAPPKPRTVSRLFWQDGSNGSVRWGNVQKGVDWQLSAQSVDGFPKLNTEECDLVQMQQIDGVLLVGVRDQQDGENQSGWIAIDCAVDKEAHDDHFHWHYTRAPKVTTSKLDTTQGNPAHLYVYNNRFYVANDAKDGFTVVDPAALTAKKTADRFYSGGGGHITMAAVDNQVCYSTWIDRDGDNKGRVDVVALNGSSDNRYSFNLPTGGIHGATANSGKVFFAPSDGVCWVPADKSLSAKNVAESVNHISLGKDASDKPLRTGAFANHLNWVMFVVGTGENASLCMLNAQTQKPSLVKFSLKMDEGCSVTTPVAVKSNSGQHFAFVFQESKDHSKPEKLLVLSLDSNADGQLGDVSILKSLEVGASQVEGHSGHHELAVTGSGRHAFLTNPGDGEIWVLSLNDLSVTAKLKVGGKPTHIQAIGG